MPTTMPNPVAFFTEYAGFAYRSEATREEDRRHNAESLAEAERMASDLGWAFVWSVDPHTDSSDWSDDDDPYQQWQCVAYDENGDIRASLHGIDFGRDSDPWGDPYRRVVEAELAAEGADNLHQKRRRR